MRGVVNRGVEPGLAVADRRGGRGHMETGLGGSGVRSRRGAEPSQMSPAGRGRQ